MHQFRGLTGGLCLALFLVFLGFSCSIDEPRQTLEGEWYIVDNNGFRRSAEIPGLLQANSLEDDEITRNFDLEPQLDSLEEIHLSFGMVDFPLDFALNGHILETRGLLKGESYFSESNVPFTVLLPKTLLKERGNVISLRIKGSVEILRFPFTPFLSGPEEAFFQRSIVMFLNAFLFVLFFGVNVVAAIYFLIIWFGKKEKLANLYFGISSFLIGFYFFELGAPFPILWTPFYRAFMKASLFWFIGFMLSFFMEYFKIHNKPWQKRSFMVAFGLVGLYVFAGGFNEDTMVRFTHALIPLQLGIMFSIYLLIRAIKGGNPDSWVIFAGNFLAVALGTHDVIHQVTGRVPIVWLQGMGFFALQLSMFISLALHDIRQSSKIEQYNKEILSQKETLAKINDSFSRFVPQEFLGFLDRDSVADVNLGDQFHGQLTVLFSDLRNFTGLSEEMSPQETFLFLNSYLSQMVPVIKSRGGIIDKYIGDAIMALFPNDTLSAFRSAIKMRDQLVKYNKGRERAGYRMVEMGIGIHYGDVILGTIGEESRMDGTVISDAVNTASRLESLTKALGVSILTSEPTLRQDDEIGKHYSVRYLGRFSFKGKKDKMAVYEVMDLVKKIPNHKAKMIKSFSKALAVWEEEPFKGKGRRKMRSHWKDFPEDTVAEYYLGLKKPK